MSKWEVGRGTRIHAKHVRECQRVRVPEERKMCHSLEHTGCWSLGLGMLIDNVDINIISKL